jgi:hypothetical protein
MAAEVNTYVDPDATGAGNGTSWTDAYTSLSACEAAEQKDFVSANEYLIINCRSSGGTVDGAVLINGSTTDATRYISIVVSSSNRHTGFWSAAKYRTTAASGSIIQIFDDFVKIEGVQVEVQDTTGGTIYAITTTSEGTEISDCILRLTGSGGTKVGFNGGANTAANPAKIWNNIIYDFTTGITNTGSGGANDSAYCYNNTVADCTTGFSTGFNDTTIKNNVAFNCTTCYNGTYLAGTNNAFSAGADPASNGVDVSSKTGAQLFNNYAGNDFRVLDATSSLYDAGSDLSADAVIPFSVDHIETTRPEGSGWDIGANEYIVPTGGNLYPTLKLGARMGL